MPVVDAYNGQILSYAAQFDTTLCHYQQNVPQHYYLLDNLVLHIVLLFNQRLAGATLLVFANKQDLPGALSAEEIRDVSHFPVLIIKK